MTDDDRIVNAMKDEWKLQKVKECERAYEFVVRVLRSPLTFAEFQSTWEIPS